MKKGPLGCYWGFVGDEILPQLFRGIQKKLNKDPYDTTSTSWKVRVFCFGRGSCVFKVIQVFLTLLMPNP